MGIFAHPDDETWGPGGTFAKYAREGVRVSVIIATSGQAGQTGGLASTREELGVVREQEARDAAQVLGVSEVYFLRYMDGRLDRAVAVEEKVVQIIRTERPDVVITFGPEGGGNQHRDHKAISQIATSASHSSGSAAAFFHHIAQGLGPHSIKKLYYMTSHGVPWSDMPIDLMPITAVIDISELVDLKLEAFSRHRSQQQWTPRLVDWIRINQNTEPFYRAFSALGGLPPTETDLFAGID
ncbi:MAG TPA: PIG-L family deacetylase [Blastocatellia bacterium]|nr:PIG-L family deacetylase [Blastocatellia bacterium]